MALILQNEELKLEDYYVDELSIRERGAIDSDIKERVSDIVKKFFILNGASGEDVENLTQKTAGYFVTFVSRKIYYSLQEIWNFIEKRYERCNSNSIEELTNEFNKLKKIKIFWKKTIINRNNEEINRIIGHSLDISVVTYDDKNMCCQNFIDLMNQSQQISIEDDNITIKNFYSWYNYIDNAYDSVIKDLDKRRDSYNQTWGWWFVSILNPVSWYHFASSGCQCYTTIQKNHNKLKNKVIQKGRNIISTRKTNIISADNSLNNLIKLFNKEIQCIRVAKNRENNTENNYREKLFKDEVKRNLELMEKRIGKICSNKNKKETNDLATKLLNTK